jgi:hypothetical protein
MVHSMTQPHRIYHGVLYFQTVMRLHGKVVSVSAGSSVRTAWPFASRNSHMLSSMMCPSLISNYSHTGQQMSKARTEAHWCTFVTTVWLLLVRFSQKSEPNDKCWWTSYVPDSIQVGRKMWQTGQKKLCASISKVWTVSESIPTQLTLTGNIFIKKSYTEFHDNSKKKKTFSCWHYVTAGDSDGLPSPHVCSFPAS